MENLEFQRRVEEVKRRAKGQWTSILRAIGVDERILNKKNQPCPINGCGGTDRFQYTDKYGDGNYHCRSCGAGGGFKLAQGVLGARFKEVLEMVERQLGMGLPVLPPGNAGPSPERMKRLCQKIWHEARAITAGDEADRYLRNRGLQMSSYPRSLRFHPALCYYEKPAGQQRSKKIGEYPAMIACVQGPDGHAVTLHRTYLKDGRKALGDQSKKVLSSGFNGAAVRLDEPTDELAIAEGIETGLAVQLSTGKPVWCGISCGNMEKIWIPQTVKRICIYADNDADGEFAGQVAAYTLAQRLVKEARKEGRQCNAQVFVPKVSGTDWADIWRARLNDEKKAA